VVAAVFYGPEWGGLQAYHARSPFEDPLPFSYGLYVTNDSADFFSPLMDCKFRTDDIEKYRSEEHYIPGQELVDRWSERLGMNARGYIYSKITESKLMPFHPTSGLMRSSYINGWQYPLETGIFALSEVLKIEQSEFESEETISSQHVDHDTCMQQSREEIPAQLEKKLSQETTEKIQAQTLARDSGEGERTSPNPLNHDLKMQGRANEIAAELIVASGRMPTKGKVAKRLATEVNMKPETVERRTRNEWR
jgi:hypothetical protein